MSIRIPVLVALSFGLATHANAASELDHMSCTGSLVQGDDGYHLDPEAGSAPWCPATIPKEFLKRILKTCAVGGRCHIEGAVSGHGMFEWSSVRSVTRR